MSDFYVNVPEDKNDFFIQLMEHLGYDCEYLSSENENITASDLDGESYFTDSDE